MLKISILKSYLTVINKCMIKEVHTGVLVELYYPEHVSDVEQQIVNLFKPLKYILVKC